MISLLLRFVWFLSLAALSILNATPQERATGPKEKSFREELKSNRKIRQEKRERKKLKKAEQKAIRKHHKRIQTKTVRKRMAASLKKSKRIREHKREFFIKRWIQKIR